MLIESSESQVQAALQQEYTVGLYFYTPFCGTCKLARRMLDICLEVSPSLPIHACNLNEMPKFSELLCIESVPCLILVKEGEVLSRLYAFHDVVHLQAFLSQFT